MPRDPMTPARALLSWSALLAFLNGAVRQLAYPSSLGDLAARQVATAVGAVALQRSRTGGSNPGGSR